jgi:hypothetical protein
MNFTKDQIANWKTYEKVRSGGRYNMYDSRARAATGLSSKDYSFVMQNYTELKQAVEEGKK